MMVFKKINGSNATFSQSVVAAILISSGFFSLNGSLYAQVVNEQFKAHPFTPVSLLLSTSNRKDETSITSFLPFIKKTPPKESQQDLPEHVDTQKELQPQDGDTFLVPSFFVYTQNADESIPQSYEKLLPPTYTVIHLENGPDTASKTMEKLTSSDVHSSSSLRLIGSGNEAGLAFFNTEPTQSSTIHSDSQIMCDQMQKGVFFDGCSSFENHGGALSARSVVLQNNQQISFTHCSTQEATSTSDKLLKEESSVEDQLVKEETGSGLDTDGELPSKKDSIWNGGAIYTFQVPNIEGENNSLSALNGYVFISKNLDVNFTDNSAYDGCGGAIAGHRFLCLDNSEVKFQKNQALFGGAIASHTGIIFHGNKKKIEFLSNKAVATSLAQQPSGGGALFCNNEVVFQNNAGVLCLNNSSQACGGAIYADVVSFSENSGETTFKNNQSKEQGGAVYTRSLTITKNTGDIAFVENAAGIKVEASDEINIVQQFSTTKKAEQATSKKDGSGGAIYCYHDPKETPLDKSNHGVIAIKQNIGTVAFSNNWAYGDCKDNCGGGALWGRDVSICENFGPVAFFANTSFITPGSGSFVGGGAVLSTNKVLISENTGIINVTQNCYRIAESNQIESEDSLGLRGGGAILSQEIEISKNMNAVAFSKNMVNIQKERAVSPASVLGGGALLGAHRVSLHDNNYLLLQDNFALGKGASGGAILSDQVDIIGNTALDCSGNMAQLFGGAVCALANNLSISDSQGKVLFSGNRTTTAGGALASVKQEVILANNAGELIFKENFASGDAPSEPVEEGQLDTTIGCHSAGGAIFAKKGVQIVGNTSVSFAGNTAGCFGGAILTGSLDSTNENEKFASRVICDGCSVEITNNTGEISFIKNGTTALKHPEHNLFGGGAIYTQDLTIARNQGPVIFKNNHAQTGGAIRLADHGKLRLSADAGDIIFQGNKNIHGESDGIFFSGAHSRIDSLSAVRGSKIQFGDALIFEDLTLRQEQLEINNDASEAYVGEINFASLPYKEDKSTSDISPLSYEEDKSTSDISSWTSKIPQIVQLRKGVLSLTDGGRLWVAGLKQHIGSRILLSAGTSLQVGGLQQDENNACAEIHSLDIDLASFTSLDGKQLSVPELILPSGVDISARGLDITLVDLLGSGYENHTLLNQEQSFTFISLYTSENGEKVALDPKNIHVYTPEITDQTYGHIGEWSSANIVNGSVTLDWKPTGYRLNPEKIGTIVPNSLWASGYDLRLAKEQQLNHQQTTQRMDFDYSMNLCVSGLGTKVDCETRNNLDGFLQRTAGIGVALDAHPLDDLLLGVGFYQMYGDLESKEFIAKNTRHGLIGSGYGVISSGSWLFKFGGAFSSTQNHLDTNYRVLGTSKGEWETRGVLWNLQADYRYVVNPHKPLSSIISAVVPFAEVEFTHVESHSFVEEGSESRQFEQGCLKNVAIPCGITLEQCYAKGQRSEVNSLSVTYAIDVYRSLPNIQVVLPQISSSWNASGIDLATQTLKVQFSNNSEWNSYFSTFLSGSYSLREQSQEYNIHTGIRLIF